MDLPGDQSCQDPCTQGHLFLLCSRYFSVVDVKNKNKIKKCSEIMPKKCDILAQSQN